MIDNFNRKIDSIRISVTDRCNLSCIYCMPENPSFFKSDDLMTSSEIINLVDNCIKFGIENIKFTGGEPLLRNDLVEIIKVITKSNRVNDISITTNGILLRRYAKELKEAGLNRINISLDTVCCNEYKRLTRIGKLKDVLDGIECAIKNNFDSIKINCVIENSILEKNAVLVKRYAEQKNIEIQYIKRINLLNGKFSKVINGDSGNCIKCNKIRVLSNGLILPCLFSDSGYCIRKFGIDCALKMAIKNKPVSGISGGNTRNMHSIGG